MSKGIVKVIMVLAAMAALSACSSTATQQPILSAADAQSTIRVTITTRTPVTVEDTLVASTD